MSDETQPNDLTDPLSSLRDLDPRPVHLDRDRFFFSAGEASARGEIRHSRRWSAIWPAAAAALAVVCTVLGLQVARMSDDLARLPVRESGPIVQQQPAEPAARITDTQTNTVNLSTSEKGSEKGDILLFPTPREARPLRAGDRAIDLSRWTPLTDHAATDARRIRTGDQEKRKTYLEIRNELSSS
jgi:hypothetical protein